MSNEFRQRGLDEYAALLWRQKLAILLPLLAVTIAVGYVVMKLPSLYESRASLKITPPTISTKVVQSISDDDVSQRLNSIGEEVKSRTSLEPMIAKFGLYERERANGVPMELIVAEMKKNIGFDILSKTDNNKATVCAISFRDRDPIKARNVTAELAGAYIQRQQETSLKGAVTTREFFDKQLADVQAKLDEIDRRRLAYMQQHSESLPVGAAGSIAQLEGLRGQEKTVETEIGRLRDQNAFLTREQNTARDFAGKEAAQQKNSLGDLSRNPGYVELLKRKGEIEGRITNLRKQYTEKHPEVVAQRLQLEQVQKDLVELKEQVKNNTDEATRNVQTQADARLQNYENEKTRVDAEIARQTQTLDQTRQQITLLQARLEGVSATDVALKSFETEYQTAKQNYDELLKKKNDADLQAEVERNAQGERIDIVDGANTPQAPVNAAKRYGLLGAGAGVGLIIGLLLAFLLELPRFATINNLSDVKHYTDLPVLAAVPQLVTAPEARWRRSVGFLKVMTGLAATAVSIPLIVIALQVTRLFDRFVS